ncbi:hypothetical protein ACIF8T_26325 [Streptomyces sp. NPDC085946]|uniref:hypothetical protein n=1 Tax=Streptomyces sp. NPDC085946 TaxID=3365744 RepID=UPI0037CD0558
MRLIHRPRRDDGNRDGRESSSWRDYRTPFVAAHQQFGGPLPVARDRFTVPKAAGLRERAVTRDRPALSCPQPCVSDAVSVTSGTAATSWTAALPGRSRPSPPDRRRRHHEFELSNCGMAGSKPAGNLASPSNPAHRGKPFLLLREQPFVNFSQSRIAGLWTYTNSDQGAGETGCEQEVAGIAGRLVGRGCGVIE